MANNYMGYGYNGYNGYGMGNYNDYNGYTAQNQQGYTNYQPTQNRAVQGQYGSVGQQQMQMQPMYTQEQSMAYVNGIEGAKAYPMIANSSKWLFDSESNRMYFKTADSLGRANIESYEYNKIDNNAQSTNVEGKNNGVGEYVTKDEYKALQSELDSLKKELSEIKVKSAKSTQGGK